MDDQDVKIAVLENEVAGLREQHKAHKQEITHTLNSLRDSVSESIDGIREDIKKIYEFVNQSKGYYAAVLIIASIIGGSVVAISTAIINHLWR